MRVLHILPQRKNSRAENYAADVILGLQNAHIEQHVVIDRHFPRLREFEKAGVKVTPHFVSAPLSALRRLRMRSLITRIKPDLAHCWGRNASQLIPKHKTPVIGWLAGYDNPRRLPRCTHFVSASRDLALRLKAPFIPAFCDFSSTPPLDRFRLATSRDAKVILSLAALHPDSNHEALLAALKKLPDCIVWLSGDGPFRRVLERKARDFDVIDRVRFADPRLKHSALLRAADMCVLMAPDRPFGTLIPQAWAAGTPVIAAYQKGLAAPLEDGTNGLLVPVNDELAFFSAARRLLDDKTLRGRMVAKAYAAYLGNYAHDAIIRQWMDLYRQIAKI